VFEDITERKQINEDRERLLINAQNYAAELDATISSISIALIVYNTAGKAIRLNNIAKKMFPAELFFGMTIEERHKVLHWETKSGTVFHLEEMPITRALRGETTQDIVMAGLFPSHKLWVSASAAPIRTSDGRMLGAVATFIDITDNIRAEEQNRASLAEKEVLLKEIHHRVKNNMQIISSLISLQADSLADEQLTEVLGDVRDRVRTMALVHEKLYQTGDLARLNFAEYVSSLLKYLWSAHSAANRNLRLNMSLVPLILPVDMAVNCGLILNELTSNSIKHAFPEGREGEVSVALEHDPATGAVCLRVSDNGVGLPADFDLNQSNSLGQRLVQILAGQMRGTVQTGSGPGTEFQIRFNVKGSSSGVFPLF
jgi:two-component sensor histidine kinase